MPLILTGAAGSSTLDSSAGLTFSDSSNQSAAASPFGLKNRIINGDMVIDQRNNGASVTPTNGQYFIDRYYALQTTAGKFTTQLSSTAPSGFASSLLCTSTSAYSVSAGDIFGFAQKIEAYNTSDLMWGTASAKTITLSFQVYSSLTGTFGGAIQNGAQNYAYPFTYSIPVANTWTTISITIAGPTAGTWIRNTNGVGLVVFLSIGTGTTNSGTAGAWTGTGFYSATGATSVVGTNGATFYITGVQLERNTTATPFEWRPYGMELALCQRYYQQYDASESAAAGGGLSGVCGTTSIAVVTGILPVEMRTTPSFNFNNLVINYGGATTVVTTTAGFYSGKKAIGMDITGTGTPLTVGRAAVIQFTGGQSAANRWFVSAEL